MSELDANPNVTESAIPFLDQMLDPDEAAKWLKMERSQLDKKRRKKQIPAIELGQRTIRFHPRTVIEFFKSANDHD